MIRSAAAPGVAGRDGPRPRAALCFALRGDLRFLSHQDEARMLVRAMRRADWPLGYSQGFNPQPHLSLPLPRSVGVASESEWAWVELSAPRSPRELFERLAPAMPEQAPLTQVVAPAPPGVPHAERVVYEIELDPGDASSAADRAPALLSRSRILTLRDHGPHKPQRPIDLRPFIEGIELVDRTLRMRLLVDRQQTARPAEILKELNLPVEALQARTRRAQVQWNLEAPPADCWPPPPERNYFGNEEDYQANPRRAQEQGGRAGRSGARRDIRAER